TRNIYNELGWKTSSTTARGLTTTYDYDALGGMISSSSSLSLTLQGYDQNHNLTVQIVNGVQMLFTYNALNQVTLERHNDGTSKAFTYDFRGNKLTETDESLRV